MTVATFEQPDFTTQDAATYKAAIDASIAVVAQVGGAFACHQSDPSTPNMTVKVDAGRLLVAGAIVSQAQQTSGTITAPVTNPRIDRVVINPTTGAISIVTGAEAASPTAPAITAGYLPCAQIALTTSTTAITDAMITDERVALMPEAEEPPDAVAYIEIRDEKAAGTDGGGFTSGAWQTRTLNTEHADAGGHASVGSNQITLAAGTYECEITAPAGVCDNHQAKLYNVTDAADTLIGSSEYAGSGSTQYTKSIVTGRFTIAGSKVFEVRHRCQTTKATDGFGNACNFGVVEVYTVARFWKVA